MKLRLLGAVCACLVNGAQAASLSSAEFEWNTFKITADSNDITSNISWNFQADYFDTGYIEGATTGVPITQQYKIEENPGWMTSQQVNDGEIATDAKVSVTPGLPSASTEVNFTGRAESRIFRFGIFTAPVTGEYSFSVNYTLTAEVNTTNSEAGGGLNSLVANPYFELDIREGADFSSPDRFGFVFDGSVDVSGFGTASNSGTITVDRENANDDLFDFAEGDTIYVTATATSLSTSYSSRPPSAVPVPPAIALFISGLGAFVAFGRKEKRRKEKGTDLFF